MTNPAKRSRIEIHLSITIGTSHCWRGVLVLSAHSLKCNRSFWYYLKMNQEAFGAWFKSMESFQEKNGLWVVCSCLPYFYCNLFFKHFPLNMLYLYQCNNHTNKISQNLNYTPCISVYVLFIDVDSRSKMTCIRLWWWISNNCTKVNSVYFILWTN